MSDNIITPAEFAEKFTIYLNTDGKPVERTIREMTSGEVLAALEWHQAEGDRLVAEFAAIEADVDAAGATVEGGKADAIAVDTLERGAAAAERAVEVTEQTERLLRLVMAAIPQWQRHKDMALQEGVRRYWPGGKAA
jgi:hypothetical protein